ncbi:hypothetical protein B0H12DRAFT_842740 [Mycena haematopus]|nr:hypothetical protein B0H12DRAFT_842740 [Mycena haematopus]
MLWRLNTTAFPLLLRRQRSRLPRHTSADRPSPLPTHSTRPTAQTIPRVPTSSCAQAPSGKGGDMTDTCRVGLSDAFEISTRENVHFGRPSMEGKPQIADHEHNNTPPGWAIKTRIRRGAYLLCLLFHDACFLLCTTRSSLAASQEPGEGAVRRGRLGCPTLPPP